MKYQFIAVDPQEYPIKTLGRVLEVAQSGYHAWRRRAPSHRGQENTVLEERIVQLYHANLQVYGSPRLHAALHAQGQQCGRKRLARLTLKCGLSANLPGHRTKTTDSQHDHPVAPNLRERDFTADAPNTKWVADITAIWTMEGWLAPFGCARHLLTDGRGMGDGRASRSSPGGKRFTDGSGSSPS